jgi:hypothetical protein
MSLLYMFENSPVIYFYLSQNLCTLQNNFKNLKFFKLFFFLRVTLPFLCVMTIGQNGTNGNGTFRTKNFNYSKLKHGTEILASLIH